jgi:hypothetical protein
MPVPSPYIFISHSTKDNPFTTYLAEQLRTAGFNVWVDVDSIPAASTWLREIEKAVTDCAAVIVVLSKVARESEWVERETLLAMDLGKPLFIALIEDMPLPLHLLNRQFSDFRTDHDQASQNLITALKQVMAGQPAPDQAAETLSPEPDEDNFFDYLAQLPDGEENALIARDLHTWATDHADSVSFGGKFAPGLHVNVQQGGNTVKVFSIWGYPRQPKAQVQFQYLSDVPPYDQRQLRVSTLQSLNRLLPEDEQLIEDSADRRPTLPLNQALNTAEKLETFKQIMAEIIDNLQSGE